LLTGGGGQLGAAVMLAAPRQWSVTSLGREALDIVDEAAVRGIVGEARPDLIINTAGYTGVDRAEREPDEAWRTNRDGAANLAKAAASVGARIVHLSTDYVFDGRGHLPYRPEDPTGPLSVYGASKLAGEKAVAEAAPEALIVRTAWLYSAGRANFLNTILRRLRDDSQAEVVDDQIGTPTSAASLAAGLWDLVAAGARGLYHYTDTGVASWYDFACAIGEEGVFFGLLNGRPRVAPVPTRERPTTATRPAFSVLDKSDTWRLLGRTAPHWRQSLREVLSKLTE
jgi:dTDP-4-dehydrorhamnose reductase